MITEQQAAKFLTNLRPKIGLPEDYNLTLHIAPLDNALGLFVPVTQNIGHIYIDTEHAATSDSAAVRNTMVHELLHARMSFMTGYAERRMSEFEKTEFIEYEEDFIESIAALICELMGDEHE